ncbi:hypothetical protein OG302_26200 [Streptomyces sp. NBC_01283]|uniref:hypothetical protein n=1 Tax=Streptomyces sp. NBC_01283 TaxID=2903812 RepID=UPI00352DCAA4|nr:hypothetical protein OG302_26200 [Streptomyces sp. NBC_01283]
MPLSDVQKALIDQHLGDHEAISAVIMGLCWNESALANSANIEVSQTETLAEACERLGLGWNPAWLTDAGFTAYDSAGTALDPAAHAAGPITWIPELRTCRLDDNVSDMAKGQGLRRRTSAELAVLAVWSHVVTSRNIQVLRPAKQSGGTRGALFRDLLIYFLERSLPDGWQVRHEVPLTHIRGLHMRRDVGDRKSDILIIDSGHRLVAALSSKWTWRSDRGTEAAQMVPLTRYRPDVPYAMATAEFPRAASVTRESIEDRTYHLCPGWAGAWMSVNELPAGVPARDRWPDLASLKREGMSRAEALTLNGLEVLVNDLKNSGDIL